MDKQDKSKMWGCLGFIGLFIFVIGMITLNDIQMTKYTEPSEWKISQKESDAYRKGQNDFRTTFTTRLYRNETRWDFDMSRGEHTIYIPIIYWSNTSKDIKTKDLDSMKAVWYEKAEEVKTEYIEQEKKQK